MSAIRSFQERSVIARPHDQSTDSIDNEYEDDDDIYGSGKTDHCSRLKPLGCPYGKFKVKKKYALMYGHVLENTKGKSSSYLCPAMWE